MKQHKVCINSLVDELVKIAVSISPAGQLAKAVLPGRHLPINLAARPPIPSLGKLGKLPGPPAGGTGLNTSAISRANSMSPKAPNSGMSGNIKRLVN